MWSASWPPGYAEGALKILTAKKNLRILAPGRGRLEPRPGHLLRGVEVRGIEGGLLLQTSPTPVSPLELRDGEPFEIPTRRLPDAGERDALGFAWAAVQSVKSNAIVLAQEGRTIGIGAGQMSRVDAVKLAAWKADGAGHDTQGSVLASDAFFPFRDGVDAAAEIGVRAIVPAWRLGQGSGGRRSGRRAWAGNGHDRPETLPPLAARRRNTSRLVSVSRGEAASRLTLIGSARNVACEDFHKTAEPRSEDHSE